MNLMITGHHVDVSQPLRDYVENKLDRVVIDKKNGCGTRHTASSATRDTARACAGTDNVNSAPPSG